MSRQLSSIQDELGLSSVVEPLSFYDALSEAAVTVELGGGVGFDFSRFRPRSARVDHRAEPSSRLTAEGDTQLRNDRLWAIKRSKPALFGNRSCAPLMTAANPVWCPSIEPCRCLGSINLTQCVDDPFTGEVSSSWPKLKSLTELAQDGADDM